MSQPNINNLAQKIWNYHLLNHKLKKSDCLLVLGSHDLRVAQRGAKLFLKGFAPLLVFSGGFGTRPSLQPWLKPEALKFAEVALALGVPKEKILIEKKSSNTGENILFAKKLLKQKNLHPRKFILVTKPYMERRAYATFKKLWPEKQVLVTSPQISYKDYFTKEILKKEVLNMMTGDLQRLKLYPKKGFQIPQQIPPNVWSAYKQLVKLGYNKHLIKE